jgi:L-ascorbate metabolism protein UlaG (beta-lactamase superfamily)
MGLGIFHRHMVSTLLLFFALTGCAKAPSAQPAASAGVPPTATLESPPQTPKPADEKTVEQVADQIAWLRSTNTYGHTAIKLETEGKVVYLDPVDLVGLDALPKADLILITHDHADHLSVKTVTALSKADTVAVSIPAIQYSLSGLKFFALAPGETVDADGWRVQGVPAYNDSHPKELGYLGFLFAVRGVRIYCSGDTGLTPEMESLTGIDIAVLNVRKPYSLSGADVVAFAETVKPKIIIPIHWIPGDKAFGDEAEIEYIRQNMPAATAFRILELTPPAA